MAESRDPAPLRHRIVDMPRSTRRFLLAFAPFALALAACGGGSTSAPATAADHGVANDETWLAVREQAVTVRVPKGWTYAKEDGVFVARPADPKAAMVVGGAATKAELEMKVRALGASFGVEGVDFTKRRRSKIHGLDVDIYEDMAATSKSQPADVLLMVADAPNGVGVAFVFVMAWDASQEHDVAIIDAASSLRPL